MPARILFVLALLLGAAACGDDDDSAADPVTGEDPTVTVDEDAGDVLAEPADEGEELTNLRTAVEAYADAQIAGDPDEVVARRSLGCAEVDTELDATGGEGEVDDVQAEVDGEEATVDYRIDGEDVQDERWVKEDGEWKWDNC